MSTRAASSEVSQCQWASPRRDDLAARARSLGFTGNRVQDGSLVGLPGATVITARHDPLRDEERDYAVALGAAGVDVQYIEFPDQGHAFNELQGVLHAAQVAVDEAATRALASFAKATSHCVLMQRMKHCTSSENAGRLH
jgi:acetyl esterase/lipase